MAPAREEWVLAITQVKSYPTAEEAAKHLDTLRVPVVQHVRAVQTGVGTFTWTNECNPLAPYVARRVRNKHGVVALVPEGKPVPRGFK